MKTCPTFSTGPNAIVKASQGCVLCFCDSHCFHRCCAWHHHEDKSRMHVMLSRASSLSYSLGPGTINRWSIPFWYLILLGRPCTSLTGLSCLACQDIPDTEALERWFVCFFKFIVLFVLHHFRPLIKVICTRHMHIWFVLHGTEDYYRCSYCLC